MEHKINRDVTPAEQFALWQEMQPGALTPEPTNIAVEAMAFLNSRSNDSAEVPTGKPPLWKRIAELTSTAWQRYPLVRYGVVVLLADLAVLTAVDSFNPDR
jgi:hypothetical protein